MHAPVARAVKRSARRVGSEPDSIGVAFSALMLSTDVVAL
jgi:hypothetical protein